MLDDQTDRALFQLGTLPSELISAIFHHGPCRPIGPFAISRENGNRHIFSGEKHYHAHSGTIEIERQWLCFSPTMKKPYCQRCWFFGDPSAMQKEWEWRSNLTRKSKRTLIASIAFGQWQAGQRIDRVQEQAIATEATFWRKHTCQLPSFGRSLRLYHLTKISVRGY